MILLGLQSIAYSKLVDTTQSTFKPLITLGLVQGIDNEIIAVQAVVYIKKGWHVNSNTPEDEFAVPTEAELTLESYTFKQPVYSKSKKKFIAILNTTTDIHEDSLTIVFPLTRPAALTNSLLRTAVFELSYQACDDKVCLAPDSEETFTIAQVTVPTQDAQIEEWSDTKSSVLFIWGMLASAFIGGLILNLMPCVLPVLSLKVFSLVKQSGEQKSKLIKLGLVYTLGILCSFWTLGIITVMLKSAGEMTGWGFQFQNVYFLIFMSLVLLFFSLNLFGMFEIFLPQRSSGILSVLSNKQGYGGAFFNGALMTLLATPCSAPYLGSAMGFAFSQSTVTLFAIFTCVALGLATPFLILSFFPKATAFMPKPGEWMNRVKELMGFLLLGTLIWILYIIFQVAGIETGFSTLVVLLTVSISCWIFGKFIAFNRNKKQLIFSWVLILATTGVSIYSILIPSLNSISETTDQSSLSTDEHSVPYSDNALEQLLSNNTPVFVDFGADWCMTCKINEKNVLHTDEIQNAFKENNITFMYGDYTRKNSDITRVLKQHKRAGVPLYIFYPGKNKDPIILSELLTKNEVHTVIKQLL